MTVQAWISRGSVYETEKLAGISHFLEHSLFKGTKNRNVGEIALEIETCGGEINAFTSFEETVYYTTLGSRYFEKGMDIIADAVQNPTFDPEEMLREREVILEEIKRSQDSPYRTVSHNLWKTAFPDSPYGRPVLGFESTVKNIDHKTLRTYFSKNYHAGSTCVFIVGDIDKNQAFSMAQQKFGKMKKQKNISIPKVPAYNQAKKPRIVLAEKDLKECSIQIAWPSPPMDDAGIPALDVLCTALGQGESCVLYQHLVKDTKVALDVNMGLIATARCGMAVIGLQVTPENFEKAIQETMNLLHHLIPQGIQESEMERVKSSLEAEVVAGKETVEGYARRLGYYTIQFGDPESEQKYLNSILAVQKPACDQALAALLQTKPVMSAIHPLNFKVDTKRITEILNSTPKKVLARKEITPQLELKKKSSVRFVEKWMGHLPIVAVKMIFPGGNREESQDKLGVGTLLQRVWTSGTPHFNSKQIAYQLDSLPRLQLGGRLDYLKDTASAGDIENWGLQIGGIFNQSSDLLNTMYASLYLGMLWNREYGAGAGENDEVLYSTLALGRRYSMESWGVKHLTYTPEIAFQNRTSTNGGDFSYTQSLEFRFLQFSVFF